jgi:hypothetical protein
MQIAGRAAVKVRQLATNDSTQARNIKMGILELKWVKRPFD